MRICLLQNCGVGRGRCPQRAADRSISSKISSLPATVPARWTLYAACVLLFTSSFQLSAQNSDAKLEEFFKAYLDAHFQQQPLEATRMGDHRFDAQLEELTRESRLQWLAL